MVGAFCVMRFAFCVARFSVWGFSWRGVGALDRSGFLVGFLPFAKVTTVARKLAKSTVERFRKRLETERKRLQRLIEEYEQELEEARLAESSSDRSPDPGNAEAGSMKFEYEKELSIEQNTLDLLDKVDRALERVNEGGYGICESCGNSIPVERLDVLPYANFCVDCARKS